jgi:L-ascorbate metabolism protein UlaG (beta-lactamase superfamily)
MKIKWNGHASFTITAASGTVIVTDPYDPSGYGGVLSYDQVTDNADAVLVSHDHADHNYVQGLPGSPKILKGSGDIGDIKVTGFQTHHDESGGSERGDNTLFIIELDDLKICFAGDLGHSLSPEQIKAIGPIELLMIPVGGTYTVDADNASEISKALNPSIVIPMHFKTEKCQLPISGVDGFLRKMENVKRLNVSEIEISKDAIPLGGQEVWVLDYAN